MTCTVRCQDGYEAQKLASLIYMAEERETYITQILNVIQNEVVISIRDGSAHSIMLHDAAQVELFADCVQSVLEKKHRITGVSTRGAEVLISKG